GHVFGPNDERGVFRSTDGGKTWKKILFKSNRAGACDIVLDPGNPNVVYAALWEAYRTPFELVSGGPGSGLYKSTDGGDTWKEITRNPGMPEGVIGNIGITVSPANSDRLWALVEAKEGGVFRSDNGGNTWTRVNEEHKLTQRAWYYMRIYADPQNPETVYAINTGLYRSNDGGHTFNSIREPHGDNHDLWIAPNDPQRMINANDGGANISSNGGQTWSTQMNQPTAQFYRVAVDQDFPYNIYGAQQDNSTVRIASRTTGIGIDTSDWYDVGGGESGWIAPYPKDSQIVFAGSYGGLITRQDHRTGQLRNVSPWPDNPMGYPASDLKYRFQWNFPIVFSPNDPDTLYAGANVLFKSTDQGHSWKIISPDLTRNDKTKQISSGGPITKDNTSIEYYDVIFTVMESPVQKGLIWVGTDDGLVQLTTDGGDHWSNVTPKGIPEWIQINSLDASPFDPGTAYVAGTMYKWDDYKPYLYKTTDYGKTWKKITNGIPDGAFTRVIREDPNRKGLLYAGTETGIYVSFDDGENWQSLQLNLPIVPVTDLIIQKREKELVAATQGRAFWILDDTPLLHQVDAQIAQSDVHLFKPKDTYRMPGFGFRVPAGTAIGENPPAGAVIYYYFKKKPEGEVTLEILDSQGKSIKKFSTGKKEEGPERAPDEDEEPFQRGPGALPASAGLNRFVWDLRYPDAVRFPGMILWAGQTEGPKAVPGTYQVKLTAGGKTETETFEVKKEPGIEASNEDLAKQFELLIQIRDKLSQIHRTILVIRDARKQIDDIAKRAGAESADKSIPDAAKALNAKLTAVEEALYQTKNRASEDPLNYPIRLNNKLAALGGVVAEADSAPTEQDYTVLHELLPAIDAELSKFEQIKRDDLTAFNKLVRDSNVPAVVVREQRGGTK
ncbi:MAG TPA: glycosyl hydrolase, partial [Blastocatellia bacterium]